MNPIYDMWNNFKINDSCMYELLKMLVGPPYVQKEKELSQKDFMMTRRIYDDQPLLLKIVEGRGILALEKE